METSPYQHMQAAVDIVGTSPHPVNKIAAALAGRDAGGKPFALSRTNLWPNRIAAAFAPDAKIGNASGTVHAETACIFESPRSEGASLFITDPPCPNCAKNIAEAGLKDIYIDHKAFDKEWARRNGHHFEHMAMKIFQKAGISVFEIYRKEQKLIPIWLTDTDYAPPADNPLILEKISTDNIGKDFLLQKTGEAKDIYKDRPFAAAFAHDAATGSARFIAAAAHLSAGYTPGTLEDPDGKYSFTIEPLNRLLMRAARHGLKVIPDYLYSSRIPTSRELVNMIGAGLTSLHIGNPNDSRDAFGPKALKQLQDAGILTINS